MLSKCIKSLTLRQRFLWNMHKWFRIVMAILIAIFYILRGILICIDNLWNIWLCIPIGLGIFILIYEFFWLCIFSANKITNAFAKVHHEKVVPRIQQKAIKKYKEENPSVINTMPEEKTEAIETKIPAHQQRLSKLSPSAVSLDGDTTEHQPGILYRSTPQMPLTSSSSSLRFRLANSWRSVRRNAKHL